MTRFLRLLANLATVLGFGIAFPGLVLLYGASWIRCLLVDQEQAAHDATLYPADLAPDSEPR